MSQRPSSIALNFFPLLTKDFSFRIYCGAVSASAKQRPFDDCKQFKLPANGKYAAHWVCHEQREGFSEFTCDLRTNDDLTKHYLFHLLRLKCSSFAPNEYSLDKSDFSERILFTIAQHPNNRTESVWLEPYFLKATREFGFLADFKLILPRSETINKRDLELSLTHKNGRQNKDFYLDRFEKLRRFVSKFHKRLFPLTSDEVPVKVDENLRVLQADSLDTKIFVFSGERPGGSSQFNGIKKFGPLSVVAEPKKIYFVYHPKDKPLSYDLYRSLNGDTFQTFDGMEKVFKFKLGKESVSGIPVNGFNDTDIESVCSQISSDQTAASGGVPVILIPFNKFGTEEEKQNYFRLKYKFLERGIASQCVAIQTLRSENDLKWSVANIALQIFAKLGGKPWKMQPANKKCLIIGLGQAHKKVKVDGKTTISKYFSYTVLTDSSGIYKDLIVLGTDSQEQNYLEKLKMNLKEIINNHASEFSRFVIHTTYSIRREEIGVIKDLIHQLANQIDSTLQENDFVVMKFNDKNKYFGYATTNNSLVPYESTFLKLSHDDYLVWFEGLQYHSSSSPKRVERPVHVEFLYTPERFNNEDKLSYLQDALNLSGANWRGFNAKSFPISVFYAKEISKYIKEFRSLNLDDSKIKWDGLPPWFL